MAKTLAWPPLILYSKPGCHLCEGLAEKLRQIPDLPALEIRDITTNPTWWERYQWEIPVLSLATDPEYPLPRPSPRLTVQQLRTWLEKELRQSRTIWDPLSPPQQEGRTSASQKEKESLGTAGGGPMP